MTTTTTSTTGEPTLTPAARRILDAASELYYGRGINTVGMDLVAEHAGTTKKTIYDRFGSKDGLVVAYLEARARRWQSHVEAHLASSTVRGLDRPLLVLDALESWMAQGTRGCGFVNAYAELSTQSPGATRVVRREKEWVRNLYAGLVAEAGVRSPDSVGRQLALIHEGAIVELTAGDSPEAFGDAKNVMRSVLRPFT